MGRWVSGLEGEGQNRQRQQRGQQQQIPFGEKGNATARTRIEKVVIVRWCWWVGGGWRGPEGC
jgi:hypothetical protein